MFANRLHAVEYQPGKNFPKIAILPAQQFFYFFHLFGHHRPEHERKQYPPVQKLLGLEMFEKRPLGHAGASRYRSRGRAVIAAGGKKFLRGAQNILMPATRNALIKPDLLQE